jgi:hypothetical protein
MFNAKLQVLGALILGALALAACGSESKPPITATEAADATPVEPSAAEPAGEEIDEDSEAVHTDEADDDHEAEAPEPGGEDENTDEDSEADHAHEEDDDHESTIGLAGDADPADAVVTINVGIANGSVVGGAQRHEVNTGDVLLIEVTLGQADEVHLHGYDFVVEGDIGEVVQIAFVADIPGVWELELEGQGIELLELEVS